MKRLINLILAISILMVFTIIPAIADPPMQRPPALDSNWILDRPAAMYIFSAVKVGEFDSMTGVEFIIRLLSQKPMQVAPSGTKIRILFRTGINKDIIGTRTNDESRTVYFPDVAFDKGYAHEIMSNNGDNIIK